MSLLIKSPFHSNNMETDPMVYGLRPGIIYDAIKELFNDRNILITGTRGIGKSSLSYQLQQILQGDNRLLLRCGIEVNLPKYITIDYTCNQGDTLKTIVLNIIEKLENFVKKEKLLLSKLTSVDIELFGAIKAKLNVEEKNPKAQILTEHFVNAIEKFSEIYVEPHINIVIDELDQLPAEYNIAHFIKVVNEILDRKNISGLSFTLVGQNCLFNMLCEQQPAFHRLIKHFNLQPLDMENAEYVLDACLRKTNAESNIETIIEGDAKNLLLGLTSGYPHSIHLLGHESFNCMLDRYDERQRNSEIEIKQSDILQGLKNALISESVRFKELFSSLLPNEKQCLIIMAGNNNNENIPMIYSMADIIDGLPIEDNNEREEIVDASLKSLCKKQILYELYYDAIIRRNEQKHYSFCEEIFRVFLTDILCNDQSLDCGI